MQPRGGSRLSPAHAVSPANAMPSSDRLDTHHPNLFTNSQLSSSPSSPLHSVARSPSLPHAPEPVKPASEKSVMFDLQPQEFEFTPDSEKVPERTGETKSERHGGRKRERHRDKARGRRDESTDSDDSDATIELPPRFDELGRARNEDPLAQKLEQVLTGLFR